MNAYSKETIPFDKTIQVFFFFKYDLDLYYEQEKKKETTSKNKKEKYVEMKHTTIHWRVKKERLLSS